DGSTDGSGEICDWYASKYKRFKVIHKSNGGVSSARNMGLDMAQGEYIGFVDPDDFISQDFYELLLSKMESSTADIATSDMLATSENGCVETIFEITKAQTKESYTGVDIFKALLTAEINGSCCDKLFRDSLFNNTRFDETISKAEDTEAMLRILAKAEKAVFEQAAKYFYRMRKGSAIHSVYTIKDVTRLFNISGQIDTLVREYCPECAKEFEPFQTLMKWGGIISLFTNKRKSQ
ncbi:MAG: glycosyltransferase, partial [Thermincola sp.]|nr:glycosyltransferase [Thermincola sp.]MDT3702678.1 glycosyltransferase [Thermincola sp.]